MPRINTLTSSSTALWIFTTAAICLAGVVLLGTDGCEGNRSASSEIITIEGVATARGNEPFSAYILEAEDGTMYILNIPDSIRADFYTPSRLTVTGRLYQDEWNGSPFAHVEVAEWAHLDD